MRKVFVDLGANKGEITDRFFELVPDNGFEVISFEPNDRFDHDLATKHYAVQHNKVLVWIDDGELAFKFDSGSTGYSSSCILTKSTGKFEKIVMTPCIDISTWLLQNVCADDFVILKVDIEGAEYEVIRKMDSAGSLSLIDVLLLDTHPSNKLCLPADVWKKYNYDLDKALGNFAGLLILNPDWVQNDVFDEVRKILP